MIVFIADHPSDANRKDGMIQRIAAIDALVADQPRCYLEISFRRHWKKSILIEGLVSIHRLNALLHWFLIYRLVRTCSAVYIHSVFNALKFLPFMPCKTFILDAHGVVPEELLEQGRRAAARVYGLVEKIAVRRSAVVVSVTDAMRQHFKRKHGRDSSSDLILPILPALDAGYDDAARAAEPHRTDTVIYAGGLQVWQNIEKMLSAAARRPEFDYVFLTGEPAELEHRARQHGVQRFSCTSVRPGEVKAYYLDSHLGFILREPILVNAVACPTKLIEYMYWGVIPVVVTASIGDFDEGNLAAVRLEDFLAGNLPDLSEAAEMRHMNRSTIDAITRSAAASMRTLQALLQASIAQSGQPT